ncbi:PIN domain-containing protein [Roseinatronobacter alkalisoli]|uniref:Ribonuclease VapC n=1 Tax=Roseinatronobacter alkalisoli TaxID=3028235 RepID=A0ABT5TGX3_9RHOB|nr:type II toxin-antitoxin system VapC family toxin [Roseinatronobacter sp. HJB301]MDD7973940.1 type II toxin-antitoxin system VapC family toxin [Roseinatronobacter sp. HJB301]
MIALDTNVLVRFLVQDDPDQARMANALFEQLTGSAPGFVSREVLVELVWVLERAYGYARPDIAVALDGLLSAIELEIEAADDVGQAVERYRNDGFGFADLMIASAAKRAGASELVTFDRKAARLPDVRLLTA